MEETISSGSEETWKKPLKKLQTLLFISAQLYRKYNQLTVFSVLTSLISHSTVQKLQYFDL